MSWATALNQISQHLSSSSLKYTSTHSQLVHETCIFLTEITQNQEPTNQSYEGLLCFNNVLNEAPLETYFMKQGRFQFLKKLKEVAELLPFTTLKGLSLVLPTAGSTGEDPKAI